MKKRLKKYLIFIENMNIADMTDKEKDTLRNDLLVQIGFFQHERLVHLIVTVTVAVSALLAALSCFAWPGILPFSLTGLLVILLVPYIIHYYILENGVQKLYEFYDEIAKRK